MSRKFVYLLANNLRRGQATYELRRIDMSGFFNPTKIPDGSRDVKYPATHPENNITTIKLTRLPQPEITFQPPCTLSEDGIMHLMRFSRNSMDHIIGADQRGNALLYDADSRTVGVITRPNHPEIPALSLTIGDSLYVMDGLARRFEALSYGNPALILQDWHWQTLPPPPYVFEPEVETRFCFIRSTAVVRDSIYISVNDIGTYSFDTRTCLWSKVGDWLLPFFGCAEYVPEYNLWFGLSYADAMLCALDLSAPSVLKPPKLHNLWKWEDGLTPQKDWVKGMSYIVHLGSGKFCVTRLFEIEKKVPFGDGFVSRHRLDEFAVLSGVEVVRGGKAGRGLRIVTHGSKRYRFLKQKLDVVF